VPNPVVIALGRIVQKAAELRGGGSALPGLVVEKLDPHFAANVLGQLPRGVVLVSGTNGKTTTVKIVAELLTAAGLNVFTNNTGSNFMRGVISSLLRKVSLGGRLDADIAVLELDEAHAVNFVESVAPRYTLLLNVMRDQLDRFGEIDYTAELLSVVARKTVDVVVLNREDSRLAAIPERERLLATVQWFGLAGGLRAEFPEDDALYDEEPREEPGDETDAAEGAAEAFADTVLLTGFSDATATLELDRSVYEARLALKGIYNAFNATAALALVHAIVPETPAALLVDALAGIHSAFGRGESLEVDGQPLELVLVKNPGGFRLALRSYDPTDSATMLAINDDYADGRDMSWLFDVGFSSLGGTGVAVVSGTRAWDMALRLSYDEVGVGVVQRDLNAALELLVAAGAGRPKRIYCTYTAMLALRKLLAARTEVERIR
jgi:UDP-N-acetylmuramyl tripeptide synthase